MLTTNPTPEPGARSPDPPRGPRPTMINVDDATCATLVRWFWLKKTSRTARPKGLSIVWHLSL